MGTHKLLIRVDDICPTMNWENWHYADDLFTRYGIKPLIGVIPNCQDPDLLLDSPRCDFWQWLKEKQEAGYSVAMHGYEHVFSSSHHGILNRRKNSEFAGLPYDTQLQKIKEGKRILESHGIFTDIFFAPAHSYDENTVKALAECGFKYVSDGKSNKPYFWYDILFLPCRNSGEIFCEREKYSTSIYHTHEWIKGKDSIPYKILNNIVNSTSYKVVDFSEYLHQSWGNEIFERTIEKLYIIYIYDIKANLSKIKRSLLKLFAH